MKKLRVLLVDDHPAVLNTVAALLGNKFQIVGKVTDGQAAVDATLRQHPDVVLMDISLPLMSGIDAAAILVQKRTTAKIVFLTVHDDPDFVKAALATGAAGYIIKSHMATDLIPAIEEAIEGHRFVSPCLAAAAESR